MSKLTYLPDLIEGDHPFERRANEILHTYRQVVENMIAACGKDFHTRDRRTIAKFYKEKIQKLEEKKGKLYYHYLNLYAAYASHKTQDQGESCPPVSAFTSSAQVVRYINNALAYDPSLKKHPAIKPYLYYGSITLYRLHSYLNGIGDCSKLASNILFESIESQPPSHTKLFQSLALKILAKEGVTFDYTPYQQHLLRIPIAKKFLNLKVRRLSNLSQAIPPCVLLTASPHGYNTVYKHPDEMMGHVLFYTREQMFFHQVRLGLHYQTPESYRQDLLKKNKLWLFEFQLPEMQ